MLSDDPLATQLQDLKSSVCLAASLIPLSDVCTIAATVQHPHPHAAQRMAAEAARAALQHEAHPTAERLSGALRNEPLNKMQGGRRLDSICLALHNKYRNQAAV